MAQQDDTFSLRSDVYARARPSYPPELYRWLAATCRATGVAWDCATGSGQAALGLAPHFELVHASDVSEEQLRHAPPHERVVYSVRGAEDPGFPPDAFDLVVVAQALHWFRLERFWPQVSRVARDGALFCAWGYDWFTSLPSIDDELLAPVKHIVEPFWTPSNRLLWNGYRDEDIEFPFARLDVPSFAIDVRWSLEQLLEYVETWSAVKRARADPAASAELDGVLAGIQQRMAGTELLLIRMPLKTVAGYVEALR